MSTLIERETSAGYLEPPEDDAGNGDLGYSRVGYGGRRGLRPKNTRLERCSAERSSTSAIGWKAMPWSSSSRAPANEPPKPITACPRERLFLRLRTRTETSTPVENDLLVR